MYQKYESQAQTARLSWALALVSCCSACARGDRAPRAVAQGAALVQANGSSDDDAAVEGPTPDSGSSSCKPIAWTDTTCDGRDDNCNGQIDEDCNFGPADCPPGTTIIEGTAGDDWLVGTAGDDCILGYGGNDELWGMAGNDVLVGGPGDDKLLGFAGNDWLMGGPGADTLAGGEGQDRLEGGPGNDTLEGGPDSDIVHGGACNDLIIDDSGADQLYGDSGSDRIVSAPGSSVDGGGGTDACDGASCELPALASRCTTDADCSGGQKCLGGSRLCVAAEIAADATCDGNDDDCDGKVDEGYAPSPTACGVGPCAATGTTSCVEGVVENSCAPLPSSGSDSTCDGRDDNCNGAVDEGYVSVVTACGVGACASSGTTSCTAGVVTNSCVPLAPAASDSTCDGRDDNCNGAVDEGYVSVATACGVGACASIGMTACVAGVMLDGCVPGPAAATDATCDGRDDDCDGAADEDYLSLATSCGVGACSSTGATACVAGVASDSCAPLAAAADDQTCDGLDDDCDGAYDENYVASATSCVSNGCSAIGTNACVAGHRVDSCQSAPVCVAEVACQDGIDNDSDGRADCADADCSTATNCQPQTFSVTVNGRANIWGAGHSSAPGGGLVPVSTTLRFGGGAIVTFTSVTGTVGQSSSLTAVIPDGIAGAWSVPSSGGIAGFVNDTRARAMVGVFLGPSEPANPAPAQLHFTDGEFAQLSPGIARIFFIGDGHTSSSTLQRFIVPSGATRLFIGGTDTCSNNAIGCFDDNSGNYQVQARVSPR